MINHARTLLLNRTGYQYTNRIGEEFIPPEFTKLSGLPNYLGNIWSILYAQNPDWLFENYRTRQYMSLLHSTELVEFVETLDPRVTYDVDDNRFLHGVFGATVDKPGLRFVGTPPGPDASGSSILKWRVSVVDGDSALVEQLQPKAPSRTLSCGHGGPIYDGLAIQFDTTEDSVWHIEVKRRPEKSLGEIVAQLEQAGAPYFLDLFGHGNTEPMSTFKNLWFQHKQLPYRLGGLLLAFIYSMEARRQSGV